ncbi:uncharacterized protein LOC131949920 [Physella acuta]|uniref:uncharacterized protein LOC131949920 n=1 Tax=Physella acuta TaxID=109671 RepID=UPI0027DC3248|nr:uncharacterized protein LOC131949920 [Physella acuta]
MKTSGIYLAIVALVSMTAWSQAEALTKTAYCDVQACHIPEKYSCSQGLIYIRCLTNNVIHKNCNIIHKSLAEVLIMETNRDLQKLGCNRTTTSGGKCDLNSCVYPFINSTSFCEEASEYVSCIQAILFDVENCHWEQRKTGYLMNYVLASDVVFNKMCLDVPTPDQKKNGNKPFCIMDCLNA